jgi:ABC-type nickel/cobalt efflux system permease component RcnA
VIRRAAAVVAIAAIVALWPVVAFAHPLGNFTINHYAGLEVAAGEIRVVYALDVAEIPTYQLRSTIDADADGTMEPAELAAWSATKSRELLGGLAITLDGRAVALRTTCATASLGSGQAGLAILRFDGVFVGDVPASGRVTFADANDPDRAGWREVTAVGVNGVALQGSDVPASSASDELRRYPIDLLRSPLAVTKASFDFGPGASDATPPRACGGATTAGERPGVEGGAFAGLLDDTGPGLVALALVLAVGLGAWHALLPGHGKTLMAAYMVGSEARVRQAIAVGSAVAVMHTASVLALGLLVFTLERTFTPEALYPWLGLVSGLVAIGLGASLLIARLSAWAASRHHDRHHDHGHPHAHELPAGVSPTSRRGLMALALAGGILPSPTALVVLAGSIQAHRVAYGVVLILAFSAGLAVALVAVGLGALRARETMARRLSTSWGRLIPVLSAGAIAGVGVFLAIRGVGQIAL